MQGFCKKKKNVEVLRKYKIAKEYHLNQGERGKIKDFTSIGLFACIWNNMVYKWIPTLFLALEWIYNLL